MKAKISKHLYPAVLFKTCKHLAVVFLYHYKMKWIVFCYVIFSLIEKERT